MIGYLEFVADVRDSWKKSEEMVLPRALYSIRSGYDG